MLKLITSTGLIDRCLSVRPSMFICLFELTDNREANGASVNTRK